MALNSAVLHGLHVHCPFIAGSETELALVQVMNPEDARKYMDENTIGLVVMFGSTYNGQFEDVVLADKIVGGSAEFCPACFWHRRTMPSLSLQV